ncbi:MAG TPA: hypothetical protein DCY54_04295 [Parachlamydiales bacterium]|nr:MAG: hypothetical protein A3D18_03270 [Chlamydiae bacterium RIFCSPHIGHO2_02_FULL_49_29]OGN64440.1 MAG: hypothetical protein A3E26_01650 [Chlamydiae bacterium RIFCSPHIGHO2_12_FULL_49_32]OGN70178.1 MAG: hypothetical protein A3I15_01570 [Chlamydiae bacterium RIFCSPLOWO2_02_FULL_49_12]OGN74880.1 MAG: hypothetical protein A3G30_02250 [Chlamydiae bacterium RIFCSPLOWO2_12_FULL_49_12]HAZ15834.1 hypothetical protein [Parachlamydiales bacterium]
MSQTHFQITFQYAGRSYALEVETDKGQVKTIGSAADFPLTMSEQVGKPLEGLVDFLDTSGVTALNVSPYMIDRIRGAVLDRRSRKERVSSAFAKFERSLMEYAASGRIGKGALLVSVVGIEGVKTLLFGQLSATDNSLPTVRTIGRTGSGAKFWTALLAKVLSKRYPHFLQMSDGLGKFAPTLLKCVC